MKKAFFIFTLLFAVSTFAQNQTYSGSVTGIPVKDRDGWFDFALVLPTVNKEQIIDFKLDTFVSPLTDSLRALGQKIDVPSNLSVPTQTERYIFNIRLSKPAYRLPWSDGNLKGLGALQGNFIFRDVIDKVRGGAPLFSLINDFNFRTFSVVSNPIIPQNLEAGRSPLNYVASLTARNDNESRFTSLGISFHKTDETSYFPVDLKKLNRSTPTQIRATQNGLRIAAIVPNSIFDFETLVNKAKPIPFSLAWNYSSKDQNLLLPILNNYVQTSSSNLFVDARALNSEHNILGYKISLIDANDNPVASKLYFGELTSEVSYPLGYNFTKVRLDVYASKYDIPELLLNSEQIIDYTDFVSRYENTVY